MATVKNSACIIFELSRSGDKWRERVLHKEERFSNFDSHLIIDAAGNLYSTASEGGKFQFGSVFQLVRPQDGGKWHFNTLYTFCTAQSTACPDGRQPEGGLTYPGMATGAAYDGVLPLYGSTDIGGRVDIVGSGVIFQLTPPAKTPGRWREKVIYIFCSQQNCDDGAHPSIGGITADAAGNLFGTTKYGGANSQGTIFEVSPDSKKKNWTETTLYTLCSVAQCADGADGRGSLILDPLGNLFGVTLEGGNVCPSDSAGCGVAFNLTPNGTQSTYSVLHAFCAQPDCADGAVTVPGLTVDKAGDVIGTTFFGGGNDSDNPAGGGTVFALNGGETVLHAFCTRTQCADGEEPSGGLAMDASGNFFGTTYVGGKYGGGTVFELSP